MNETKNERDLSGSIAVFSGVGNLETRSDAIFVIPRADTYVLRVEKWPSISWTDKRALLRAALDLFVDVSTPATSKLAWAFSQETLDLAQARQMQSEWDSLQCVPALGLITFYIRRIGGDDWIATEGLGILLGYEIEARTTRCELRPLGKAVAKLTQHDLDNGPAHRDRTITDNDVEYFVTAKQAGFFTNTPVIAVEALKPTISDAK